jgi:hypothetical protein
MAREEDMIDVQLWYKNVLNNEMQDLSGLKHITICDCVLIGSKQLNKDRISSSVRLTVIRDMRCNSCWTMWQLATASILQCSYILTAKANRTPLSESAHYGYYTVSFGLIS